MTREARGDERVVAAPDEQRRRLELGQPPVEPVAAERRLEIDVAGAREQRVAGAGGVVDPPELVDHEIGDRGIDQVAVVEHAPELRRDHRAAERVREQPELRPQQPDDRMEPAPDPRHRGAQQPERADPLGRGQADLDRDPAAHRVADDVRPVDLELVHQPEHDLGEPAGVVAAERRLGRGAEAGEVGRVDAVVAR